MALTFPCVHCDQPIHWTPESAGTSGRCPKCGGTIFCPITLEDDNSPTNVVRAELANVVVAELATTAPSAKAGKAGSKSTGWIVVVVCVISVIGVAWMAAQPEMSRSNSKPDNAQSDIAVLEKHYEQQRAARLRAVEQLERDEGHSVEGGGRVVERLDGGDPVVISPDLWRAAIEIAKKAVRSNLSRPRSAKFEPGIFNVPVLWKTGAEGFYLVRGNLEAQNGFGVAEDLEYGVLLQRSGDGFVVDSCDVWTAAN